MGDIMEFKTNNVCTCAHCNYFKLAEYFEYGEFVEIGICRKHQKIREIFDEICDDFVILQGLYTNRRYPKKEDFEK